MTPRTRLSLLLMTLVAGGCAPATVSGVRFANAPIVWKVDDRRDVAKPRAPGFAKYLYYWDRFVFRRTTRLMEVPEPLRAANINALDEAPDSSWFTNRIHRHPLTPEQVGGGPNVDDGPSIDRPWTVLGTKVGGSSPGFLVEDSRGVKYLLKFDLRGVPEMETAAAVIVQRLLWAAGFNVPEDTVVTFRPGQLVLADGAKVKDTFGNERAMTPHDLAAVLARADASGDGRYRALASKYLRGIPLGGVASEGTRPDDPNDVVPHEERRELRGQYVIFSWLDHSDVKTDNMLDMWIEDSGDPSRHYLIHYLVDFGKALGVMGWIERRPAEGYSHYWDFEHMLYSLLSVGLWRRPWEGADGPPLRGVARFEADHFDPGNWRPQYPWEPFARRDRFDGYWGAKIVAAFSRRHIRAAVEAGRLSDPRAASYLTETLVRRRRAILRYWFDRVAPLDRFALRDGAICFDDLALVYRVAWAKRGTFYTATAYDYDGARLGDWVTRADPGSGAAATPAKTACVSGFPTGDSHDGYTILRLVAQRDRGAQPPVELHLARDAAGALRIIGLYRR